MGTVATTRPGRGASTITVSARKTASVIECVTSRVVGMCSVQIRSSSMLSRCLVMSSSAPNGSSRSSTCGSSASARAMATRCRMPPESWAGFASSNPLRPTSRTRSPITALSARRPAIWSGNAMFAVTVRHGSSAASWNAMPVWCCFRAARGGSPCTVAVPVVGSSRAASIRKMVDFPHPEGPMSAVNEPRGRSIEISDSAATPPFLVAKVLPTLLSTIPVTR